jgi:hypothetical protein
MDEKGANNEVKKDAAPSCSSHSNGMIPRKAKLLFLYLIYAEIILNAGIKLGAFHKKTAFSDAEIAAVQNSLWGSQQPQVHLDPLPNGILAFDQETNQT